MKSKTRRGFTVLESLIAMSALAVASVVVAQLGALALTERARLIDELALLETADNVLESARALDFEQLTPEWANRQTLPPHVQQRDSEVRLRVLVEPMADDPAVKRVEVRIERPAGAGRPVELVGYFGNRQPKGGRR